jgi:hypothetical protein
MFSKHVAYRLGCISLSVFLRRVGVLHRFSKKPGPVTSECMQYQSQSQT